MIIANDYKTGNRKLDLKIAEGLLKDPRSKTKLQELIEASQPIKQPRIAVSDEDDRTYKDGTVFASAGELRRWDDLLKVQSAGQIKNLRRQVVFVLQKSYVHEQWGNVSALVYIADFVYTNITYRKDIGEREVVEDSKGGHLTEKYRLKKKLFLYKYGGLLFYEV